MLAQHPSSFARVTICFPYVPLYAGSPEIIPDAWFGKHIPLERHGLRRRCEHVSSCRWETYIVIGEK